MGSAFWAAIASMLLFNRSISSVSAFVRAPVAVRSALVHRLFSSAPVAVTDNGILVVNEMPPPLPTLKNDFYLLRHGQSEGNVEGVISSARSLATSEKHSLTQLGYEQAQKSATQLLEKIQAENDGGVAANEKRRIFFYSSPFARARQTAQACMDSLTNNECNKKIIEDLNLDVQADIGVIIEDGVMERFFGRLDDEAIHTYAYVWPVDMFKTTHTAFDVESVAAVSTRLRESFLRIDGHERHANCSEGDIIVVASHADVLQIAQVYAAGAANVGTFSQYRFANGEVRKMKRTVDSLPDPEPLKPPAKGT